MANFSIIDTHTHGYFPGWNNREMMFERARQAGVMAQIQIGCDERSTYRAIELAQQNGDFYASVGVHPNDVKYVGNPNPEYRIPDSTYEPVAKTPEELFELFDKWIEENKENVVGVGECGFDFYHDAKDEYFEAQEEVFLKHVELAKKHDLPLIVHTRNATEETIEFFKKHIVGTGLRGVVHCFSEDLAAAKFFTEEAGFLLGIGGIVTYKKSDELREVVREIGLKYLVTETDAPFLTPQEWRKGNSINEPAALVEVVKMIAEVREEDTEKVAKALVKNGVNLFKLKINT